MKKALIYTSVASMIDQFNRDNIQLLLDEGYEVHVATNFEDGSSIDESRIHRLKKDLEEMGIEWHHIPIPRKITAVGSIIQSCVQTVRLFRKNNYHLIHMHSPIGAAIGRIAVPFSKLDNRKIIYTAHGFHFFKGSSIVNWLMFYPLEFILSFLTDTLITINTEDYERAQKLHAKEVKYVPGVGVEHREPMKEAEVIRKELGLVEDDVVILSIGELNPNKNHREVILALENINLDYKYLICGQGDLRAEIQELIEEKGLTDNIQLLGYRQDIPDILSISNIFCLPSYREGLSVGLMEAMIASLPCVVSDIRGNRDLIDSNGGYRFKIGNQTELQQALSNLIQSKTERIQMGEYNQDKINKFSKQVVNKLMAEIYHQE